MQIPRLIMLFLLIVEAIDRLVVVIESMLLVEPLCWDALLQCVSIIKSIFKVPYLVTPGLSTFTFDREIKIAIIIIPRKLVERVSSQTILLVISTFGYSNGNTFV